jgi:hypothetical protein
VGSPSPRWRCEDESQNRLCSDLRTVRGRRSHRRSLAGDHGIEDHRRLRDRLLRAYDLHLADQEDEEGALLDLTARIRTVIPSDIQYAHDDVARRARSSGEPHERWTLGTRAQLLGRSRCRSAEARLMCVVSKRPAKSPKRARGGHRRRETMAEDRTIPRGSEVRRRTRLLRGLSELP